MKLCQPLVKRIHANGRTYRVNLDFRNVLNMMQVLSRHDLMIEAKRYKALKCVMRHPPKDNIECWTLFTVLCGILFNSKEKTKNNERITDFEQDADLIRGAFLQAYNINLWRDKLHWQEFTALLGALPQGSRYMDVLSIRARPIPSATKYNRQEREELIKAKALYSLELSEQEKRSRYASGLRIMAESMQAYAEAYGGDHR